MILVTGASGCLGRNVIDRLRSDHRDVRALVAPHDQDGAHVLRRDGVADVRIGDVRDAPSVRAAADGCTAVVHLAGVAGVAVRSARHMMSVNRDGARVVAEVCHELGLRMVHVSSASAVGLTRSGTVVDETFDFGSERLTHPYPLSKRAGEQEVLDLVGRGLDAVVLNPGAVLAPGGDPTSTWSGLPQQVAAGRFRYAPPGGFGFCGAPTLVAAVTAALRTGGSGERYLLVDANLTYAELMTRVARKVGAPVPRGVLPAALVTTLAWATRPVTATVPWVRGRAMVTPAALPFLTWDVRYDGSRAREVFGLRAEPVDDILARLVDGTVGPRTPARTPQHVPPADL